LHRLPSQYLKMMMPSKPKRPTGSTKKPAGQGKGQPNLEDFFFIRDYTGALALLEFRLKCQDGDIKDILLWIGYAAFHLGNFRRAEEAYKTLLDEHDVPTQIYLYLACCYFFQQMFDEAQSAAEKGPNEPLRNRLLFNIAHRKGDETTLMQFHSNLRDKKEDQLCLAAVHYLRSHHQEVSLCF
jgi:intraflagellar transport protein 56